MFLARPGSYVVEVASSNAMPPLVEWECLIKIEFFLNTVEGVPRYLVGETCLLEKDVEHAEEAGVTGASILFASKSLLVSENTDAKVLIGK